MRRDVMVTGQTQRLEDLQAQSLQSVNVYKVGGWLDELVNSDSKIAGFLESSACVNCAFSLPRFSLFTSSQNPPSSHFHIYLVSLVTL